tara:strand:- start:924 stop:1973 length:1050 start_codon:yes stop_codon:yes gene_type:complete
MCFYLLLNSCATVVAPSGGEIDTLPPKLVFTTPNNQSVNFTQNEILLVFDEYIQIKNKSEVNFFPEINPRPTIIIRGKSIILELPGELKPNTTHIVNFNSSIVDINESNPLKNFKYVFSTGDIIDTCQLIGDVFDLKSNAKTQGAKVGLFKNKLVENFDSLIRTEAPDYFIYSNENGQYSFSNLKSGNYILYGTRDLNLNSNYEGGEPISMPVEITIKDNQKSDVFLFIEGGFSKKDTLNFSHKRPKNTPLSTGSVNFNFKEDVYKNGKHIGEIMLNDSSFFCFYINSNIIQIDSLLTGVYSFRMFEDANENNTWDPGDIKNLIPPEKIKHFVDNIEIKKDWKIDFFID